MICSVPCSINRSVVAVLLLLFVSSATFERSQAANHAVRVDVTKLKADLANLMASYKAAMSVLPTPISAKGLDTGVTRLAKEGMAMINLLVKLYHIIDVYHSCCHVCMHALTGMHSWGARMHGLYPTNLLKSLMIM